MTKDVLDSRLKVRPDVFFVRSQDGVWLRNNLGSFSMRGGSAYELIRRLFARLDGTRSFEDTCQSLGLGDPKALYERLMVPLIDRGFVRRVSADASSLSEALASRFAEQLAFLELYVEDPAATLMQVRREGITCIGSGHQLRAMAVALAELGFIDVELFTSESEESGLTALEEIVAAVEQNDDEAAWVLHSIPRPSGLVRMVECALEGRRSKYGVVATDTSARSGELVAACSGLSNSQKQVFVAAPAGTHVWATPALSTGGACMECIVRSIVPHEEETAGPAAVSLAAFQVAQRLFSSIAAQSVPQAAELTTVDSRTLLVQSHTVRRHERCSVHRVRSISRVSELDRQELSSGEDLVRPSISKPTDSDAMVAVHDRLVEIVSQWIDPLVGPLLSVGEDAVEQLPLAASCCRFTESNPTGDKEMLIKCMGLCARETRNQVVLWAIESMVEGLAQELPQRVGLVGLGAGWSFGEAVYRAVAMAALRREFPHDELASTTPLSIEHDGSARLSFLYQSLSDYEKTVCAHEVPSSYGLVRVELETSGKLLARGVGLEPEQALEHAFLAALARQDSESGEARTVVVHPAPRAKRWDPLAEEIVRRVESELEFFSMRHIVPFVGVELTVVGVAPRDQEVGRERS